MRACPRRIKCKPIAKRFETCVETNKTRESFDNTWNIPKISIRCSQICFNFRRVFLSIPFFLSHTLSFFSSYRTTPIADQYLTSKFHLLRIAENSLSRRDFSSVCCIEIHLPAPFFFWRTRFRTVDSRFRDVETLRGQRLVFHLERCFFSRAFYFPSFSVFNLATRVKSKKKKKETDDVQSRNW